MDQLDIIRCGQAIPGLESEILPSQDIQVPWRDEPIAKEDKERQTTKIQI
jgi:hypothetical protein